METNDQPGTISTNRNTCSKINRPLLVLDLDETLISSAFGRLGRDPDFYMGPYQVYIRPYLNEFLSKAKDWFKLAVWTSATDDYAHEVVSHLFEGVPLEFVWSADKCTPRVDYERYVFYNVKDLRKVKNLGFSIEQILIVDDSPEKAQRNYGNYIRVVPFDGNPADTELKELIVFLDEIRSAENFRVVEKRGWKNHGIPN